MGPSSFPRYIRVGIGRHRIEQKVQNKKSNKYILLIRLSFFQLHTYIFKQHVTIIRRPVRKIQEHGIILL